MGPTHSSSLRMVGGVGELGGKEMTYYCCLWYGTTQPNEGHLIEWWVS